MTLRSIGHWSIAFGLLAIVPARTAAPALGQPLPQPESMTVDRSLSKTDAARMIKAARLFYAFWDTGDEAYVSAAVDNDFRDNTLPEGRPQGPVGLVYASQTFRTALPDLHCKIEDLLVSGDKVTARLVERSGRVSSRPEGRASDYRTRALICVFPVPSISRS